MYSRKLALVVLTGGLLSSLPLAAQRAKWNKPAVRPETTGTSIIPNGGFELPRPTTALPQAPAIPKDYPVACLPSSPKDKFGSSEEAGSIFEKLQNYADANEIEDLDEIKIETFRTFVNQYIEYLKQIDSFAQGNIEGWQMYPTKKSLSSNAFTRTPEGRSGAALRIAGNFPEKQQIYVVSPEQIPVHSKAQYLVSFFFRGNLPLDDNGDPISPSKALAYVKLRWIPKAGETLKVNGKEMAKPGKSWEDIRNNSNSKIKTGFFDQLTRRDFSKDPLVWQEVWMVVDAPENVASVVPELEFPGFVDSSISNYKIEIDDFTMTLIKGQEGEAPTPVLQTPTTPKRLAQRYTQREASFEWTASSEDIDGYELEIAELQGRTTSNAKVVTTKETKHIFEGLEPGKNYQVRLRSVKGTTKSEYSTPSTFSTRSLGGFTGGEIPFLYTINEDGTCPQKIGLYYTELSNPNAKFTYFIDDQEVKPEGKTLSFPSTGEHELRIIIEESADKVWELNYQLNVK